MRQRVRRLPLGAVVDAECGHNRHQRDGHIDAHCHVGRDRHVVHPQQIETGSEASHDGADCITAVERAEPRRTVRRGIDQAAHGRKRSPHEQRRRQKDCGRNDCAEPQASRRRRRPGRVDTANERNTEQRQKTDQANAELEQGVDTKWMRRTRHDPREQGAPETHASHERAE